jgi:hypothetical protein
VNNFVWSKYKKGAHRMSKHVNIMLLGIVGSLILVACSSAASSNTAVPGNSESENPSDTSNLDIAPTDQEPGPSEEVTAIPEVRDFQIVTLLPRDAIPAIDNPTFLSIEDADQVYSPDELVIGVEFNGEARAYSIPLLSRHEIVNDTVGGVKIAVTW